MHSQFKRHLLVVVLLIIGVALALHVGNSSASMQAAGPGSMEAPLPQSLSGTGLFLPGSIDRVREGILPFSPQYPLWSDGASKRRWISLPPGTTIDASDPDAWEFPPGTRFWKEFSLGRRIETRYIERMGDGSWRFATYVWGPDGADAALAPEPGIAALAVDGAPGGTYVVPSHADCLACHAGAKVPVLGFGALQLSPDRDPLAPHAEAARSGDVDLLALVAQGWLVKLPRALLENPPRIAAAAPKARAALGYLHGNCAHCHRRAEGEPGAVPVDLSLWQSVAARSGDDVAKAMQSILPRYRAASLPEGARLLSAGDASASLLPLRMRSRNPYVRMPPLGSRVVDADAVALIDGWINHDLEQN